MLKRAFQKTRGRHGYKGKYSSRGKRLMSKLYGGLDTGNVYKVLKELEVEKGGGK